LLLRRYCLVLALACAAFGADDKAKTQTPASTEAAAPAELSPADRLVLREMQVTALQAALRLKEAEVSMLRGRVQDLEQRDKHEREMKSFESLNHQLQVKGEALRLKYGAKDHRLTFDLGWEKKAPGEKE